MTVFTVSTSAGLLEGFCNRQCFLLISKYKHHKKTDVMLMKL